MNNADNLSELNRLISEIENISTRIKNNALGQYLKTEDEAFFKQRVMETMTVLDEIFGDKNKYSLNVVHTVNEGSGGYLGGLSLKCLLEVVGILRAAQKHALRGVKGKQDSLRRDSMLDHMTQQILLEELRGLLQNMPPLEGRGAYGPEQFTWLGRASALISNWDTIEGNSFSAACNALTGNMNRPANYGEVLTTIHKAITLIEKSLPSSAGQVFGAGAAYDFFKALNKLVSSAEGTLFLVDPYMDAEVFDGYLSALTPGKRVRLLVNKYTDNIKVAAEKFRAQHSSEIEVRKSTQIHDRLVFVDDAQCWVLGASIKDAAKKPTYLAPLSNDLVADKLRHYEAIWEASTPI